jgi:hypothetical protein
MGRSALITGWSERVEEVASALEQAGYNAIRAPEHELLPEQTKAIAPGSVDCYVQLPGRISARGETVVERVRNFLTDGLIRRFDAVAVISPTLRSDACVLLVSGNHPDEPGAPDNQRARLALLQVLAHSLLIERGGTGMTVTIIGERRSPAELVELVHSPSDRPVRLIAELKEIDPELDYDDWRNEVMAFTADDT